jgi:hypothetical protein
VTISSYVTAFVGTIGLEVATALALGFRQRSELASVVLVNVFTHPLLCYLLWVSGSMRSVPIGFWVVLPFEAGVVLVEWWLLCFALRRRRSWRLLGLSLAMNGVSFLAGVFLR